MRQTVTTGERPIRTTRPHATVAGPGRHPSGRARSTLPCLAVVLLGVACATVRSPQASAGGARLSEDPVPAADERVAAVEALLAFRTAYLGNNTPIDGCSAAAFLGGLSGVDQLDVTWRRLVDPYPVRDCEVAKGAASMPRMFLEALEDRAGERVLRISLVNGHYSHREEYTFGRGTPRVVTGQRSYDLLHSAPPPAELREATPR